MMVISHPNIVPMKEVIREGNAIYFVMEYMDANLFECMLSRPSCFSEEQIRNIM